MSDLPFIDERTREVAAPVERTWEATTPGFRVVRSIAPRELALEGNHHFSRYALTYFVEEAGEGRSRLRARTNAEFPGLRGTIYRAMVIGTRGHVAATRRMLDGIARRAERAK